MYFEDIVNIKESDCCEKCSSFEYDLPCRVDKNLIVSVSRLVNSSEEQISNLDKLLKSSNSLEIRKDDDFKIEFKPNTRYLKLCAPSGDLVFKAEIEDILIDWISDTLNIEIERI